jgi:tetratricopeptide (TPR) repeat protein
MNSLSLLSKAEQSAHKGRYAVALSSLTLAQKHTRDRFLLAEIHWQKAESLRALGQFAQALAAYWTSHKLYRLSDAASERLRSLIGASSCLRVLGRYGQAQKAWRSVAASFWARSPEATLEHALVLRGLGRHAEARRNLLTVTQTKEPALLQNAWWALAGAERFLGHFPSALKAFQNAARLARQNKDPLGCAYAFCGEAACHRILGNARPALQKYEAAYSVFVREKDPFGTAYGLCGMANAHRVYGDARKCLPLYQKSFKLYMKLGDKGSAGFALWGLGGAWRRLGDSLKAAAFYNRSLRHFQQDGDKRGVAMACIGLAGVFRDGGKMREFSKEASRALDFARKNNLSYEAALCRAQGGASNALNRFGVSKKAYSRWRDIP